MSATFENGAKVAVYNETLSGKPVFEGWAKVVECVDPDDRLYTVRFSDDPGEYLRRVVDDGRAQTDPKGHVADLLAGEQA